MIEEVPKSEKEKPLTEADIKAQFDVLKDWKDGEDIPEKPRVSGLPKLTPPAEHELTPQVMAEYQRKVFEVIWEMAADLRDYPLIDMLNVCAAGAKKSPDERDRQYFAHHGTLLRLAIGFSHAAHKTHDAMMQHVNSRVSPLVGLDGQPMHYN